MRSLRSLLFSQTQQLASMLLVRVLQTQIPPRYPRAPIPDDLGLLGPPDPLRPAPMFSSEISKNLPPNIDLIVSDDKSNLPTSCHDTPPRVSCQASSKRWLNVLPISGVRLFKEFSRFRVSHLLSNTSSFLFYFIFLTRLVFVSPIASIGSLKSQLPSWTILSLLCLPHTSLWLVV